MWHHMSHAGLPCPEPYESWFAGVILAGCQKRAGETGSANTPRSAHPGQPVLPTAGTQAWPNAPRSSKERNHFVF